MVITGFEKIEKEKIENLRFPSTSVLNDMDKIKEMQADLDRALSLGNLEHSKIKIYFEDDISCKYVDTTVWGVTDKLIILKQGVTVPINRVHFLEL